MFEKHLDFNLYSLIVEIAQLKYVQFKHGRICALLLQDFFKHFMESWWLIGLIVYWSQNLTSCFYNNSLLTICSCIFLLLIMVRLSGGAPGQSITVHFLLCSTIVL